MTTIKWVIAAAAVLGIAAVTVQKARATKDAPSSEAQLRAELAELRGELRTVSAAHGAALGAAAHIQSSPAPAAVPTGANDAAGSSRGATTSAPSAPVDPQAFAAEQMRRANEAAKRVGDKLDTVLAADQVDTVWLADTSRAVDRVFGAIADSHVRSTECGSRLCRVVVEEKTTDELRALASQIADKPPFDQDVLYRYDMEASPPRVTLYVTRPGTEMASLVRPAH
jgi:hypothetical protein